MSFALAMKLGNSCNILRFTLIFEFYLFGFIFILSIKSLQIDRLYECYFIEIEFNTFSSST